MIFLQVSKKFIALLWGPLFVGVPVRPNMLNKLKSACQNTGIRANPQICPCITGDMSLLVSTIQTSKELATGINLW